MLDPVRFSRTDELKPAEKERIKQVVLRRLKREINERTNPPRFCTRKPPQAIELDSIFSNEETALIKAFEEFRKKVRGVISSASKKRRLAGIFAIEILGKRMLSGPMTFLDSWQRCKIGLRGMDGADDNDVLATEKTVKEETADDLEAQQRESVAVNVIGSWMKVFANDVATEIEQIDEAASKLSVDLNEVIIEQNPSSDARFKALSNFIDNLLREDGKWKTDERLVVFTEYKTTLDYLLRRFRENYSGQEDRFLCLFGGMHDYEREQIKDTFNDSESKVRVLIATDAASEGLNLQSTARCLLHYDCPWNPSRLEQRNGRLDRHGQARDVYVYHFASEQDSDLKFISYLINKVDQIKEDLGATGELFDEATHRRLIHGDDIEQVQQMLEIQIKQATEATEVDADDEIEKNPFTGESDLEEIIDALAQELDLDASTARKTLETAMAIGVGRPQLTEADHLDRFEIINPGLAGWKEIIDEAVRKNIDSKAIGPVPKLSFSSKPFMQTISGRQVFRPRLDTLMLHLGHPLVQKANSSLSRRRFPGPSAVSRWTVKYGEVPSNADALMLLHLEEFAVNELRETFHHWLRTVCIPIKADELGSPLPHQPAIKYRGATACLNTKDVEKARELLGDLEPDLKEHIKTFCEQLTDNLKKQIAEDGENAKQEEDKRYRSRQAEVSTLIAENSLGKLEREIGLLKQQRSQGLLFENQSFMDELDRSIGMKEEELYRRQRHYEEIREQLGRERERIIKYLLPKRYSMQESAQVFPVAVEIRFPMPKGGVK